MPIAAAASPAPAAKIRVTQPHKAPLYFQIWLWCLEHGPDSFRTRNEAIASICEYMQRNNPGTVFSQKAIGLAQQAVFKHIARYLPGMMHTGSRPNGTGRRGRGIQTYRFELPVDVLKSHQLVRDAEMRQQNQLAALPDAEAPVNSAPVLPLPAPDMGSSRLRAPTYMGLALWMLYEGHLMYRCRDEVLESLSAFLTAPLFHGTTFDKSTIRNGELYVTRKVGLVSPGFQLTRSGYRSNGNGPVLQKYRYVLPMAIINHHLHQSGVRSLESGVC